jgi:hypothetical protein
MSGLVAYAVAVAAGEIATRIVESYEQKMGNGKAANGVAKAARKAAELAWDSFGSGQDKTGK